MVQRIIISPSRAVEELDLTWPSVLAAIERFERLGMAREVTGKKRNRLYEYAAQLEILDQEVHL